MPYSKVKPCLTSSFVSKTVVEPKVGDTETKDHKQVVISVVSVFMDHVFMCWTVLKRLYEMNKESVDKAVRKRLQIQQSETDKLVL